MSIQEYISQIKKLSNPSFQQIRSIANREINSLSQEEKDRLYHALERGVKLLEKHEELCQYLYSYGNMHEAKIREALKHLSLNAYKDKTIQVIDWGCGQGLATVCFFDFQNDHNVNTTVSRVVLIEPSEHALERAKLHTSAYVDEDLIVTLNKFVNEVSADDIESDVDVTIHFFSNILDVNSVDVRQLAKTVADAVRGEHYLVCVGPLNANNERIESFYEKFNNAELIWEFSHNKDSQRSYTGKYRIFKIERFDTEPILVEYNPPKQFHAAFRLDCVRELFESDELSDDKEKVDALYKQLSSFEVSTPFDIGANIYEDVNPVFAVLNNIVVRGLPTKASQFVENSFRSFGNSSVDDNLGGIRYSLKDLDAYDVFLALHAVDGRLVLTKDNYNIDELDSGLEAHYICNTAPKYIRQILCPQVRLSTITDRMEHKVQRVDFAVQFPYDEAKEKGLVIELDGSKYHESRKRVNDDERSRVIRNSKWICKRIKESEVSDPNIDYAKSDYLKNVEAAFNKQLSESWIKVLQLALSPIGIARIQKAVIEALLIEKLDIQASSWDILVQERDVPCSALALADLKQMFDHLTIMTEEFDLLKFPKINLTVISTPEYKDSSLHAADGIEVTVLDEPTPAMMNHTYDMVIDISVMRRTGLEKISFSDFKSRNDCHFHIRSSHYKRNERQIYTTDVINYKPLVEKEANGEYKDNDELKPHLEYFMQTLFRKKAFRPGQLPILSRALQNKCVIGLLPTGGGKSLTYQVAAMLQPGVTVVVDPLRSLMKDQFDGLLKAGIDTCTFINSTITDPRDKEKRAEAMEKSLLQFVFLSPERLCIYSFRERLKNMHDLGVYFSYGVIDEVHCVSEWGHDFRFTYLHLGRNLYNYVLPKQTESRKHLTLFGLTATASFDVLADVERELSGDGQFPLDSDTIVRDENTNRLELQYKIEKVPVEYSVDKYYDKNNILADYPKALSINDKWAVYESKQAFVSDYMSKIPNYIRELQTKESIERIVDNFFGRQNKPREQVVDLRTDMPDDFASDKEEYTKAGIIFCPHKNATGISVNKNACKLSEHIEVGTFMGSSGDDTVSEKIDEESFKNLELFRDNKLPLMVATKAFGMGIDKPNVRFTVNMNYSSSLESFVQEAGRAGRDRHTALSVILLSDYNLVRVNPRCKNNSFPMAIIRGRWFKKKDLELILKSHNVSVDEEDIDTFSPQRDMVKLKCEVCNVRFGNGLCDKKCDKCSKGPCELRCPLYDQCTLKDVPREAKGFQYVDDLKELLLQKGIRIKKENMEYMNADYETVLYFFNNNFKGSLIEKRTMHELLSKSAVQLFVGNDAETKEPVEEVHNFLKRLLDSEEGTELVAYISTKTVGRFKGGTVYVRGGDNQNVRIENMETGQVIPVPTSDVEIYRDSTDVDKAIYRMCCIGLIDDFTKDYGKNRCRIVSVRKKDGDYYKGLQAFLERYYSKDKAAEEIAKVPSYRGENEVHKCLGYLTEFIYDKIAVKRKRAIDDMRTFCMLGAEDGRDWLQKNEELKDFIYYYFNSKYARRDFNYESLAENDKSFSLTRDTDEGKVSSMHLVYKYMRVIDDDITSQDASSQIDNVKHLQGAVRLIRRSLTDSNPTIDLLNVFCLLFLGTGDNENLRDELKESYISAYLSLHEAYSGNDKFYETMETFKKKLNENKRHVASDQELKTLGEWEMEAELSIHLDWLHKFRRKYVN